MTRSRQTEVVVTAANRRSEMDDPRVSAASTQRGPGRDHLAADPLFQALARRLAGVEEWCRSHSEYFLG